MLITYFSCYLDVDGNLLVFWVEHLVMKCAQGRLRLEHQYDSQGLRGFNVLLKIYLYLYLSIICLSIYLSNLLTHLSTNLPIYSVEYLLSAIFIECCML